MVKIVNFMLCVFYHSYLKKGKKKSVVSLKGLRRTLGKIQEGCIYLLKT